MEMNTANVAQLKIVRGKPSFVGKKKDEKKTSRFGELSREEIQEIVDNAVLVTTKIATRFGTDQSSFP